MLEFCIVITYALGQVKYVMMEKTILSKLSNPFIVR